MEQNTEEDKTSDKTVDEELAQAIVNLYNHLLKNAIGPEEFYADLPADFDWSELYEYCDEKE